MYYIVHDIFNRTAARCNTIEEVKQEMIRIHHKIDSGVYFYDTLEHIVIEGMTTFEIMAVVSDVMKIVDQNQLIVTNKDDETEVYFTF